MAQKKLRKCSVCRLPGHTKRTCKTLSTTVSSSHTQKSSRESSSHIMVRFDTDASLSPHRVALPKPDTSTVWNSVQTYQESKPKKEERVTIDLAKLVSEHNQRQQQQEMLLFRNAMKKYVSKRLRSEATAALVQKIQHRPVAVPRRQARAATSPARIAPPRPPTRLRIRLPRLSLGTWWRHAWSPRKLALSFAIMLLLVSMPFPAIGYVQKIRETNASLVQESTNGFLALQASTVAALHANIGQAGQDLDHALASFAQARSLLEKDYHLLLSVAQFLPIIGDQVKSRQRLLVAGQHLALGNTYLIKGLQDIQHDTTLAFSTKLGILRTHMRSAAPQYEQALAELRHVNIEAIPAAHQKTFEDFRLLFATFVADMEELIELIDAMQLVLGDEGFRRYLVVFQNHHELRPTGGFVGSYALLDVQKGNILNITVPEGGSYDLQGQLSQYLQPPLPLQLVNGRWEFHDSNWFPDFAASAQKMAWFYEHARDESIDGVIAVNASVLERFLRVVGPIMDEQHQLLIADYDALEKIQSVVEDDTVRESGMPKAILSRLLDQLMNRLNELEKVDLVTLLAELHSAAQEKEIQLFMRDTAAQQTFREFGWTGEIYPTTEQQDYLFVVNTNVQGQKSDARVQQHIEHQAVVQPNGSVIDSVTIRRTHTGDARDTRYGANNISYMRIYVPEGATLLEASGFTYPPEEAFYVPEPWYTEDMDVAKIETHERFHIASGTRVTEEFGKTVFGNWVMTAPGYTSEVTLVYELPFSVIPKDEVPTANMDKWKEVFIRNDSVTRSQYQLVLQKQSGVTSAFESTIQYPEDWVPVWRSHDEMDLTLAGAAIETVLDQDQMIRVLMEREVR